MSVLIDRGWLTLLQTVPVVEIIEPEKAEDNLQSANEDSASADPLAKLRLALTTSNKVCNIAVYDKVLRSQNAQIESVGATELYNLNQIYSTKISLKEKVCYWFTHASPA